MKQEYNGQFKEALERILQATDSQEQLVRYLGIDAGRLNSANSRSESDEKQDEQDKQDD